MRGEGEVFIDLGEMGEAEEELDSRSGRRPMWRVSAPMLAPLLALCVLALVAGSPPKPQIVRIADFPGVERGFLLVDGGILRQDTDEIFLLGTDGRERWRVPWRARADDFPQASTGHGRLLMRTMTTDDAMRTVAFDLQTGARRWELDGWVHTVGDILVQWEESALRMYDADAGQMLWESVGHLAIGLDFASTSIFVIDREERLSERDMRTGEVRRSRQLSLPVDLDERHIEVGPEHVMVAAVSSMGQEQQMTFFDRRSLQPIHPSKAQWNYRFACGAVDCVVQFGDGTGGGVVDRATGRVLWSVPEGEVVVPWENGTVMIMRYSDWAGEAAAVDVVDPVTRRSLVKVKGWTMLIDTERLDFMPAPATPIALYRAKGRPTLVAHVGAAGLRVLGSVPDEADNCRYIAPLLQCRASRNTIGVWRIDQ